MTLAAVSLYTFAPGLVCGRGCFFFVRKLGWQSDQLFSPGPLYCNQERRWHDDRIPGFGDVFEFLCRFSAASGDKSSLRLFNTDLACDNRIHFWQCLWSDLYASGLSFFGGGILASRKSWHYVCNCIWLKWRNPAADGSVCVSIHGPGRHRSGIGK